MLSLEIDHNFSKAHRIVTASILPIVERYAEHSKDVWEGSKVNTPGSMFLQYTPSNKSIITHSPVLETIL